MSEHDFDPATSASRRDFIRTAAAAAIGTTLAGREIHGAFAQGSDAIRIGLIGCGGRGTGAVLDALAGSQGVTLVAMGDAFKDRLDESRAQLRKQYGAKIAVTDDKAFVGFDAFQKVLATDANYIILATPPGFRPQHLKAAVAAGKHSTAISIHFALASPPTVATPLPVKIAIVPHATFATVSVHFESHDGLTMPMGEDFGPVNDVAPEKPLTHELMLLPSREGMFMVTATVDTLSDEGNVVRIFSIPVVVGPAQPASAPVPK